MNIIFDCIALCCIVLYHIITLHEIASLCVTIHTVISHHITTYHIISIHIILCCTTLIYIVHTFIHLWDIPASWMFPRSSLRSVQFLHPTRPLPPPRRRGAGDGCQGAAVGWRRRHPQGISSCPPAEFQKTRGKIGEKKIGKKLKKWRGQGQGSANC